ncbi:MAG: glycoside hydrolase family 31 protein [Planctomycetota bacterium]
MDDREWKKIGNGLWSVQLGSLEGETKYSDLAGAPPKIAQLNRLVDLPLPPTARQIQYRVSEDHKVSVRIPTDSDEQIFGFGLQFDRTRHNRRILTLNVDHFARGGGATHAPVPFYMSTKGYGVFINTARFLKVYCQVGNRKGSPNNPPEVDRNPPDDEPQPGPWLPQPPADAVEAFIHGNGLELIMIAGTDLQDIVARYNLLGGGGAMPPLWGLGFWHRVPSQFSADQTLAEVAEFNNHNIPLDVIGLEPGWQTKSYPCTFEWQKKRFPDPKNFARELLNDGVRLNLWINPYISQRARIYKQMEPLSGSHLVWLGIVPDYTLPQARRILVDQHKRAHFDIGISGYKVDEVDGYDNWLWPDHASFPSGTPAEVMRQVYGLLMQEMLYKDLFRPNDRRTLGLVRASNGAASCYPFAIYSDSYGHQQYVTGFSSSSLAGILWCPEIRSADTGREWINRMHTVCLSPVAMLNAWASGMKPWSFPEATDAVRRTIELRMRLLPYLYTAFATYRETGIPPIRSMLLETGSRKEDNTLFMFGPDILVAPFIGQATRRTVNLPQGNWYDFYTGKLMGNAVSIDVSADQTHNLPPLFVKEGAVIPMLKKSRLRTRDMFGAELEIRHYGTAPGRCELYEDDGTSFDHEKGAFNIREFSVEPTVDNLFTLTERSLKSSAEPFYGQASLRQMTTPD